MSNNTTLNFTDKDILDMEIKNEIKVNTYKDNNYNFFEEIFGNIYNLVNFGMNHEYDLKNISLKEFLREIIKNNHYKKDNFLKYLIYELIEFYFSKVDRNVSFQIFNK